MEYKELRRQIIKKKEKRQAEKKKRMFNTFTQKHTIINSRLETKVQT